MNSEPRSRRSAERGPEHGNVMFYILIAVALMAALIFAVNQSGRGSVGAVNEEKARIIASELIDYSNSVATGFSQLRLRGCKIEEISFENAVDLNYTNGNAPGDKSCHVFELAGGGITFKLPPAEALASTPGKQLFTTGYEIHQVGASCDDTACTELVMATGPLKKEICDQVNDRLGINKIGDPAPEDAASFGGAGPYQGAIAHTATLGLNTGTEIIRGKTALCIHDADDQVYYFIKVLAAR